MKPSPFVRVRSFTLRLCHSTLSLERRDRRAHHAHAIVVVAAAHFDGKTTLSARCADLGTSRPVGTVAHLPHLLASPPQERFSRPVGLPEDEAVAHCSGSMPLRRAARAATGRARPPARRHPVLDRLARRVTSSSSSEAFRKCAAAGEWRDLAPALTWALCSPAVIIGRLKRNCRLLTQRTCSSFAGSHRTACLRASMMLRTLKTTMSPGKKAMSALVVYEFVAARRCNGTQGWRGRPEAQCSAAQEPPES